jgi:hypothetical protein
VAHLDDLLIRAGLAGRGDADGFLDSGRAIMLDRDYRVAAIGADGDARVTGENGVAVAGSNSTARTDPGGVSIVQGKGGTAYTAQGGLARVWDGGFARTSDGGVAVSFHGGEAAGGLGSVVICMQGGRASGLAGSILVFGYKATANDTPRFVAGTVGPGGLAEGVFYELDANRAIVAWVAPPGAE